MDNEYFSVEAILAENQKIQCMFKRDLPGMGHLGGGTERDIHALNKLQIPIWLAYTVVFSLDEPFNFTIKAFGSRVRNALKAEARSVRLNGLVGAGGFWYGLGRTIMNMVGEDQAGELSDVLVKAFHDRMQEIVDQAQHFAVLGAAGGGSSGNTSQTFREGLDMTERELFALAQESAKITKRWYEETDKGRK